MQFPLGGGNTAADKKPPLMLHNTLTGKKEPFHPLKHNEARLYHCGPTVYDYAHLGNLRAFVFADILRRTLAFFGHEVRQVINITDIGHLTSDADVGEDKMALAIKREGEEMTLEGLRRIADKYTQAFLHDLERLNILMPHALPRASEYIPAQIALVRTLVEKEYAYETSDGIYFDTARFPHYGALGHIAREGQKEGARVAENPEKRNPEDFALWKKGGDLGWDSPWGKGFPGWHTECVAMIHALLGKTIDIHTGGIDHIPVHHNNEIAQAEAATGKPLARFWLHVAFLTIEDTKISKSLGNTVYLRHVEARGYRALDYRYLLLTAHYRSPLNFTWRALDAAHTALRRLQQYYFSELRGAPEGNPDPRFLQALAAALGDDLDTPRALALLWETVKDSRMPREAKRASLLAADRVLALGLTELETQVQKLSFAAPLPPKDLPEEVRLLVIAREEMREQKNWARADELREEIARKGFRVEDTPEGPLVYPEKS